MSVRRPDPRDSDYVEDSSMRSEFSREERDHCLSLLRRLRFLEHQVKQRGGAAVTQSDNFVDREFHALRWALNDIGFITQREKQEGKR